MTDPREQIETNCLSVTLIPDIDTWEVDGGYVDWPEVVELAQKILAADEAWKDAQTPVETERQFRECPACDGRGGYARQVSDDEWYHSSCEVCQGRREVPARGSG